MHNTPFFIKVAIVLLLLFIIVSLFSALFYLGKDKGSNNRTAKALTLRIGLSIFLFIMLMVGYYTGLISNVHP
jgi:glycerol uptake facilitator-like aquaporin